MLALGIIPLVGLVLVLAAGVLLLHRFSQQKSQLESEAQCRRHELLQLDQQCDRNFVAAVSEGRLSFADARDDYRQARAHCEAGVSDPADHWTVADLDTVLALRLEKDFAAAKARALKVVALISLVACLITGGAEAAVYVLIAPQEIPLLSPMEFSPPSLPHDLPSMPAAAPSAAPAHVPDLDDSSSPTAAASFSSERGRAVQPTRRFPPVLARQLSTVPLYRSS